VLNFNVDLEFVAPYGSLKVNLLFKKILAVYAAVGRVMLVYYYYFRSASRNIL
jgi:hypothetical protein